MNPQENFWTRTVVELKLHLHLPVTVETTISEVIRGMQEKKTGAALVFDEVGGNLAGIVTTGDIMHSFIATTLKGDKPVTAIMTKNPMTIPHDTTILEVFQTFYKGRFRHVPVTGEDGKVVGLLSVRRLMRYLAEQLPAEVLNQPPDRSLIPEHKHGG